MSARDQLTTTTDQGSVLWTLEEIGRLVSHSGNPAETLTNIVHLIKRRFETDVCSVYLLEPDRANLVLAATIGLRPESVGRVRMRLTEGLAGLVAEQLRPQVVADATAHPRFKYFREAGEDPYRSFLGVPIIDRGLLQGVLVVQTVEPRGRSARTMCGCWSMAGAQLAPIVSEARTLGQFVAPAHQRLCALAQNLWWSWDNDTTSLFRELDPVLWREFDHNPIALLQQMPIETLEERALAAGAAQPDQLRLPPHAGVPAVDAHVGRAPRRRAVGAAGRLLLRRVRPARVAADLLRRPRHPGRRSHQERVGPRHPAGRRRPLLRPGLLPAAARRDGWQHEDYLDVDSGLLPMEPAHARRRAGHGRRSRRAPARSPRASGSSRSAATRCCCSTRTSTATSPEDRELTARLYGGDDRVRIRQELLLGVGGVRALRGAGHLARASCT